MDRVGSTVMTLTLSVCAMSATAVHGHWLGTYAVYLTTQAGLH